MTDGTKKGEDYCIYCHEKNYRTLYPVEDIFGDSFHLCYCRNCHAYFLSPKPTPGQLAEAYDESYYGKGETKFVPVIEKVIDFFRWRRSRYLLKHLPVNGNILDIGCGNGNFLHFLSGYGTYNLYGIEPQGNSVERAKKIPELHIKTGVLEAKDFPENTFDAVTMFHVFEHLDNPKETLQIISKIIKQGGIFIISLPNITSWQSKIFRGKWLHLDPPRHLVYFTSEDLVKELVKSGFRLVRKKYVSTEQNPFGMVQSMLNIFHKNRECLFERLKGNKNYAPEYGKLNYVIDLIFFLVSFPVFIITDSFAAIFNKSATMELTFVKDR